MTPVVGRLIVLEGGDHVGKSTQAALLADWLRAAGHDVVLTRQPGGTAVGARIRELLLDPATGDLDPRAEALLYAADKAQHLAEVVEPALARGAIVVCDRFVDSMIAYQGHGRGQDVDALAHVAGWATNGRRPDLTVLLDADPARALGAKADHDRLEAAGVDFHGRVRAGFCDLARERGHLVVAAEQSIDDVAATIRAAVTELLERPA